MVNSSPFASKKYDKLTVKIQYFSRNKVNDRWKLFLLKNGSSFKESDGLDEFFGNEQNWVQTSHMEIIFKNPFYFGIKCIVKKGVRVCPLK